MMNNQAIQFLKTTFTSNSAPEFSNNPTKIDKFSVGRREFLNFVKNQEDTFLCSFVDISSRTNNRRAKNEEYLNATEVVVPARSENIRRLSPLFTAVDVLVK
jgi:hypothetical protein